ncbi:hypothetical protein [Paenibacillus planticolens]|uniref:DUF4352 domain-containing protein n=1 Tax=Paenibacillus planticolens TaxID=2654976 RepID=A0ABX1ZMA4_9BACL|nr:hypothetical protein [Paenibacillus planticolens]NOV00971.1 hypothetical protein [Paenibacillus planticolens]
MLPLTGALLLFSVDLSCFGLSCPVSPLAYPIDLKAGDNYKPVSIRETNGFTFNKNEIIAPFVEQPTRGVVWADVTLDGQTFTTNKIFMDLLPYQNLAGSTEITASHNQDAVNQLVDGKTIEGIHFDQSKWSVPANEKAWIQFKLPTKSQIANINLTSILWNKNISIHLKQ